MSLEGPKPPIGGWKFLGDHEGEIRPLLDGLEKEKLDLIEERPHSKEAAPYINELLEKFETKIFSFKNEHAASNAKRIIVEASFSAAFKVMNALIEKMRGDAGVSEIVLLTDNLAGKYFAEQKDAPQEIIRGSGSVFADIGNLGNFDIAFAMEDARNGPASFLLYNSTGEGRLLRAEKLYYLLPGFVGETTRMRFTAVARAHADEIGGVVVGDEKARELASVALKVPIEKIIVAGTPLMDGLAPDGGVELRRVGRKKAGIDDSTVTALFLGDNSEDYKELGFDSDINVKTFVETLHGLVEAAQTHPDKQFAFLVRRHPKAPDEHLMMLVKDVPANLRVVNADASYFGFDETIYAADVICCSVTSTESFLARYRGREAALMAYEGKGMGGDIARWIYDESGLKVLAGTKDISILSSGRDLAARLMKADPLRPPTLPPHTVDSTEKIRDILLS